MKLTNYTPFQGITNYSLEYDDKDQPSTLYFNDKPENSFQLKIRPNGYIPKSGVFLCQSITPYVKGKSILDIGTGETGIISIFSSKHGASRVTAVDIDKETISWALKNGNVNKLKNIKWLVSDKYNNVNEKFDLIVSNPPQLPMINGSLHDSGGEDGRIEIDQIINRARKYLNKNGTIIILVFDFLSTNKQFGKKISIFDLMESCGLTPSILAEIERVIRPEGKTYEALKDIKSYYPKYKFKKNKLGELKYKMQVIKGDLN